MMGSENGEGHERALFYFAFFALNTPVAKVEKLNTSSFLRKQESGLNNF